MNKDINDKINNLKIKENEINIKRKKLEEDINEFNNNKNKAKLNNLLNDMFNASIKKRRRKSFWYLFDRLIFKRFNQFRKKLNPSNLFDVKTEIKNCKDYKNSNNKMIIPFFLMTNWLEENGYQVAIEKITKDVRLNNVCVQQIFNKQPNEKNSH